MNGNLKKKKKGISRYERNDIKVKCIKRLVFEENGIRIKGYWKFNNLIIK